MKLTKEALKQLIKEEIEEAKGVANGTVTDETQGNLLAQAIEKVKDGLRAGDSKEDELLVKIINLIATGSQKLNLGSDSKIARIVAILEQHLSDKIGK